MADGAQTILEVYVGSFGGRSFGAWWNGEHVVYESFGPSYSDRGQSIVSPSAAQWSRFWRTVDELEIWDWSSRFEPGERFEPRDVIHDGTHWSLTLGRGSRFIESSGDSSGPGALDLDESQPFASLCAAVSRLLGGREFG
jgi:hypothetical protein